MATRKMAEANNLKIQNFWNWFKENSSKINPEVITEDMIDTLDSKILELGDFAWEIREGISKPNMLIISPGGDVELLEHTKSIIENSLAIDEWEFEYFKPAKEWDYSFYIDEESTLIDASDWEYVLLKFSDGTFDILIKAENINTLDDNDKSIAIDIVLESSLGEKNYLERILNYELVSSFEGKYAGKQNNIKVLGDHLLNSIK